MTSEERARSPLSDDLIERFKSIPPPTIGHILFSGFMDTAIRPLYRLNTVVVGRAVAARLLPGDLTFSRPAIQALGPGDILVMDLGGDQRMAAWGEMTSLAAQMRGAVGVIIDGMCTDVLEITEQRMPTWARGLSALVARRLNQDGAVNVPVQCGGVVVHPGDLIVADDNGIVVIPPSRAEEIYTVSRAAEDRAPFVRIWIRNGGPISELAGLSADDIAAMNRERGWA